MKKLILFLSFIATQTLAQNISLKGEIKDHQNEAAIGATVQLLALPDSSQTAAYIANAQGKYEFNNLKTGNYILKISYIGANIYLSPNIKINTNSVTLPTIFLQAAKAQQLSEVVVKTTRPLVIQEADKTIINVEAMGGVATLSANDVLARTQGVVVDQNGSIQLNGRSGVMVLIDGRPTYMSGNDLQIYLKSLPANMLDKLELMDEPPAKYDAAGAAIINIVLKKNRLYGLTGNIASNQSIGYTWRSYNNLNLNYRQGKLNLFGGVGLPRDANRTISTATRTIIEVANSQQYNSENINTFNSLTGNIRLGFDYDISKKTVLGGQLFFQKSDRNDRAEFSNIVNNINFSGNNIGQFDWQNLMTSLNFSHKPKKQGSEWSGDVTYQQFGTKGMRDFETQQVANTLIFNNIFDTPADIFTLKTDYKRPLSKKTQMELGAKIGLVNNGNDAKVQNQIEGVFVDDPSRSNHFIYNENINAAYLSLRHTINKHTSIQAGLRAENTNIEGNLLPNLTTTGERFSQHYTNLFPTFFIRRQLDSLGKHNMSFSYGRRLNRPNYQQFNPFLNYIDDYSYNSGNPTLKPFYLQNFQIRYQNSVGISIGVVLDFANGINGNFNIREGDKFVNRPYNLGNGYRFGVQSNYNKKLSKVWTSNLNIQVFQFNLKGTVNGDEAFTKFASLRVNTNQQFSFGKGWSADIYANYSTKDKYFNVVSRGWYQIYAGIGKKILKEKGSIRLLIDDPFWSDYRPLSVGLLKNATQEIKSRYDTRRIGFNFSYRFGNEKYSRRRQTEDAGEEERRRVQ